MSGILDKIIGDLGEKKEWKQIEARAKALPKDFAVAYNEIKKYIWSTAGTETIEPFKTLIDLFEEAAANGKSVVEVIGSDVAGFVDELVRDEKSYFGKKRQQLNDDISKKLGK
jgi:DNA-binding ferritin-like protein (Dps family)